MSGIHLDKKVNSVQIRFDKLQKTQNSVSLDNHFTAPKHTEKEKRTIPFMTQLELLSPG